MKNKIKLILLFSLFILTLSLVSPLTSCTSDDYAAAHLSDYGVPSFSTTKFQKVERFYRDYYVEDIPSATAMAKSTAEIYFENYHEKIDTGDVTKVTDALINSYVEAIGDKYSAYRVPVEASDHETETSGSFAGIDVTVSYNASDESVTVISVTEGGGADDAGIQVGDTIIAIGGESVADIGYDNLVLKIRGEIGTAVDLTLVRDGEEFTVAVTRKQVVVKSVKYSIEDKIGYIDIDSFKGNTFSQFKEAIDFMEENGAVAIIYDLRSNPGGLLDSVVSMLSYIAPNKTKIASFSNNYMAPKYDNNPHSLSIPSVILCNGNTASAAELFTSAMRDFDEKYGYFDVTTVGTTTYGKGIMQSTFQLGDGSSLTLTVAYYNPPSGKNYHGVGITPDVEVKQVSTADSQLEVAYTEVYNLLYPTVTEQLTSIYGVPTFNVQKFKEVEKIFEDEYVTDLPRVGILARDTAVMYFEQFHEIIDTGDTVKVTDALLECYVTAIGDRYSTYRPPVETEEHETEISGSIDGINVSFTFDEATKVMTITGVTSGGGAHDAGIKAYDEILAVNGEAVADIGYAKAVQNIRGTDGTTVNLTILRDGVELEFTVTRKTIIVYSVEYSMLEGKIGYIAIKSFRSNTLAQFKEAIDFMEDNGAKAIIYDLRSNGGGLLLPAVNMLSYIAPKNTTIVSFSNNYAEPMKDNDSHALAIPSVVLCNKATGSAAELFVAAMRDFDEELGLFEVTTVGVTTYGKGIMQATYYLEDESSVTLTVAYYNPPSGENYHGVGIEPDVTVETKSEQLEAACAEAQKLIK